MAHKKVNLAGKIAGTWNASQGMRAKTNVPTLHYNGPPTGVPAGRRSAMEQWRIDAAYHMRPGIFEARGQNGMQYHSGVWEDTVYLFRNPLSILWHCGHAWNYTSHGIAVPIGEGERVSKRTLQTLEEWIDEICDTWKLKRSVVGHKELSSTACPGTLMNDFVYPYRRGASFGGSAAKPGGTVRPPTNNDKQPEAGDTVKRLIVSSFTKDDEAETGLKLARTTARKYPDAWLNKVKL